METPPENRCSARTAQRWNGWPRCTARGSTRVRRGGQQRGLYEPHGGTQIHVHVGQSVFRSFGIYLTNIEAMLRIGSPIHPAHSPTLLSYTLYELTHTHTIYTYTIHNIHTYTESTNLTALRTGWGSRAPLHGAFRTPHTLSTTIYLLLSCLLLLSTYLYLQSTIYYYNLLLSTIYQSTTICYYLLLSTTIYLLLTTIYYYLLLSTTIYYYLLSTTIYYYLLLSTIYHYYLLLSTTIYYYLLLSTTTIYYYYQQPYRNHHIYSVCYDTAKYRKDLSPTQYAPPSLSPNQ
jgi:hypothetical protein